MNRSIRVLIIDDSAVARSTLSKILNNDPEIEVVATAPDALIGLRKIGELNPDVLTLDVEMPKMDGLTFLDRLMNSRPMPVVMVSAHTGEGSESALRALQLGAVEVVEKPRYDVNSGLQEISQELSEKIKAASQARLKTPQQRFQQSINPNTARENASEKISRLSIDQPNLIAIGASTGGTEVIRSILSSLSPQTPGIVITQHMPKSFTPSFANSLNRTSQISVKEAQDGDLIQPGHAFLAPGGLHMRIKKNSSRLYIQLEDDPPINRHRPSVDALFESVALCTGGSALGILLTGMGGDGAQGMRMMYQRGAWTIAQEESTCVVYGMPRVAVELGVVREILSPDEISARIASLVAK